MRRVVTAGIGLVAALGTIGITAPAQAATTAGKDFYTDYGATWYKGSVSFSNQTVSAYGRISTSPGSGCRYGAIIPFVGTREYAGAKTPTVCDGAYTEGSITSVDSVRGGYTSVVVAIFAVYPDGTAEAVRTTKHILR
ncbi:hypothetical protein OHA70_16370 [Kribbella sp. NBC_00382]|uniref:hypothetical protein n=1 Tax=Kribbella sp. NBC_00382 TaxID=2975967 RepID=UPI002E1B83E8